MIISLVAVESRRRRRPEAFYDEYFVVLDLTEEFYIDTVKLVFQGTRSQPKRKFPRRAGRAESIRRTALFTAESERTTSVAVGHPRAGRQ